MAGIRAASLRAGMLPAAPVVGMRPAALGAPRCPMPRSMLRRPLPMRSCLWPSAHPARPKATVLAETAWTVSVAPALAPGAMPASRRSPVRPMVPAPLYRAVRIRTNTCTDETATNPCGNDGTCDGAGACRKVSNSKICTPASCSADKQTFTPAATCDGAGTCPAAKAQDCGAFQCATTGCLKICAAQADCDTTSYCDTGTNTCAAKLSNGSAASQGYQCTLLHHRLAGSL